MIRSLEIAIALSCVLAVGALYSQRVRRQPAQAAPAGDIIDQSLAERLRTNTRADIFRELDPAGRRQLAALVVHHCRVQRDVDSCLHYVISCGRPCLADLTDAEQDQILADFVATKKKFEAGVRK